MFCSSCGRAKDAGWGLSVFISQRWVLTLKGAYLIPSGGGSGYLSAISFYFLKLMRQTLINCAGVAAVP